MSRFREKMRNMTIGKRIIFYTYIVIMPILILSCIAVTVYQYSNVREEYVYQQKSDVNNVALSLNIIEEDVRYLSLNLVIDQDIQDLLTIKDPESLNQNAQLWQRETPVSVLEDLIALKGYIRTLAVYPENGVIPYLRCKDSSSAYYPNLEDVRGTSVYQQAVQAKGAGIWISAPKGSGEIYQTNRSEKLVLCRAIYNQSKSRLLGYMTIGISQEQVEKICSGILDSSREGVLLLDRNGNPIVSYGYVDTEVEQHLQEQQLTTAKNYQGRYKDWEIFTEPSSDSGWQICKILPAKGFWDYFGEIVYIPAILSLGICLGVWPLVRALSGRISSPLQEVCRAMVKFRQGDFEQQVTIRNNDEVGEVAACFNQMVVDIKELINRNYIMVLKERESELAVLQAQINPHFLYNALDSIYWQATSEGDDVTAESIYELSQLFRLILGQGKSMVTVKMEMELVERYLEVQKFRFHEQMEYCLETEPTILEAKIPKLILQPFVENAVIHGMQNNSGDFLITVMARPAGEYLEFLVRDTGVGMNEEQLKRIWEEDGDRVFTGQRIGRYAIKNVKERLELRYGSHFELAIESQPGQGTLVRIRVPLMEEEENGIETIDS